MGLHRDGEKLGLTPFDAEIRRRVWWQIVALDSMYATTSGMKPTSLLTGADTQKPRNVNDIDFSLDSASIQSHEGPTEMVFVLFLYEVIHFSTDHQVCKFEHLVLGGLGADPGTPEYEAYQASLSELQGLVEEFDVRMSEAERKYCDLSGGPIHALALFIRRHLTEEGRLMSTPMEETPEWGTEVQNQKDNFFRIWLAHHEGAINLYDVAGQANLLWAFKKHFSLDSLVFLAGQLAERSPVGSFAERAWKVFDSFYHHHEELWNFTQKLHWQLAKILLKAWEGREQVLQQMQEPINIPVLIPKLRAALSQVGLYRITENDLLVQPLDNGLQKGCGDGLQFSSNAPEGMLQNLTMPLDWSLLDDQQLTDAQNPALPIFALF